MRSPTPVLANLSEDASQACGPTSLCSRISPYVGDNEFLAQFLGVLVPDILRTLLFLGVAWLAVRVVRRGIRSVVTDMVADDQAGPGGVVRRRLPLASTQSMDPARAAMRTETLGNVLRSLASMIIWTIAVIVAIENLRTIDVNLGPLIAGAGIVGVALGFGSQSLVKDFLSGIFMLLEDQYGIGDIIDAGPATGVVEGITLRTTRVRDLEGVLWHIPNGEITRVGNLSQQWSRSLLDIPVAYATHLPHAIDVIKRTADELWHDVEWSDQVLEEPDVWGVEHFGDDGVLIRVVLKTVPAKQWAVSRELRLRLKAAFDDAGIEIPFPQRTVWFRQDEAPPATDAEGFFPAFRSSGTEYAMEAPRSSSDGQDGNGGDGGEEREPAGG